MGIAFFDIAISDLSFFMERSYLSTLSLYVEFTRLGVFKADNPLRKLSLDECTLDNYFGLQLCMLWIISL